MSFLLDETASGASGVVMGRLARMASFIVAYSGPKGVLPSVIDKLEQNIDQFNIRDLLNLTNGLQVATNAAAMLMVLEPFDIGDSWCLHGKRSTTWLLTIGCAFRPANQRLPHGKTFHYRHVLSPL